MRLGQRQTAIALGAYALAQLLLGLGLLGWEFFAAYRYGSDATISVVLQTAWAHYPWPFFIAGVLVTALLFWLLGHFFGQNRDVYDRMRKGGGVLALLALACPVQAAQTPAEKQQTRALTFLSFRLGQAARSTAWAINECDLASYPKLLTRHTRHAIAARMAINDVLLILMGGNTEEQFYGSWSRAEQVAHAYGRLGAIGAIAQRASSNLTTVLANRTLPDACRRELEGARAQWVEVPQRLALLDTTLTYTDPRPFPPAFLGAVANSVTPHGDYANGTALYVIGTAYAGRVAESVMEGWTEPASGVKYGGPLWAWADVADVAHHMLALRSGVEILQEGPAADPPDAFCRFLRVGRLVLGSKRQVPQEPGRDYAASFRLHGLQQALAAVAPHISMAWLQDAMFRLSDAWEKFDLGFWEDFRFPNPSRCSSAVTP